MQGFIGCLSMLAQEAYTSTQPLQTQNLIRSSQTLISGHVLESDKPLSICNAMFTWAALAKRVWAGAVLDIIVSILANIIFAVVIVAVTMLLLAVLL